MKVDIKDISPVLKEMKLTIEAEKALEDYTSVLNSFRQYAALPGFRKGKAPLAMIERSFSNHIREEFYNQKLKEYYSSALETHKLNPVNQGEALAVDWEKGQDLNVTFRFEVMPEIRLIKTSGLNIPYEEIQFEPRMLTDTLEDFRYRMAVETDSQDVAVPGDKISATFNLPAADSFPSRKVEKNFILGTNPFSEVFNKNLTGVKPGDEIKTILFDKDQEIRDDDFDPDIAGKEIPVMINAVKKIILPELNDEFAKDLEYDSLDAMKSKIENELKLKIKRDNQERLRTVVMDKLIEENPFDLPGSMIKKYAESMARPYAKAYKIDLEKIMPMYSQIAAINLKSYYILEEIKKKDNIQITEQDREELIREAAAGINMDLEKYRKLYEKQLQSDDFTAKVEERKIIARIVASSKFVPYPNQDLKKNLPAEK
ncbi:MAG: trigger factor [Candidatus Cloacimonetes bacterium]|nr:trigger factor [Candidatus Cloacimonadota bacterium]